MVGLFLTLLSFIMSSVLCHGYLQVCQWRLSYEKLVTFEEVAAQWACVAKWPGVKQMLDSNKWAGTEKELCFLLAKC